MRKGLLAAVLAGTVALPAQAAPFWATPDVAEMKRLKSREVILDHQTIQGTNVNQFRAVGVVNAPWEKVLRYYGDADNTKKFQTAVKKLEIIERTDEYQRKAKYDVALPWPLGNRQFVLDVWAVPAQKYIEWKLVQGDVKEFRGSYALTPWGEDQTLVSYQVASDLNTWLPPFIIAWAQKGTIPNVITKARQDLEN